MAAPFFFCHLVQATQPMNHFIRTYAAPATTFAFLAMLLGCGGGVSKPDGIPPLTPMNVTVNYQGAPVEGATVIFAPLNTRFAAVGLTNANGKAVMKTDGMYEGVVADEFKISIIKQEILASDMGTTPEDPKEYAAYMKKLNSLPKPKSLIPEKYASVGTSQLQLKVTEGTPQQPVFDLKD